MENVNKQLLDALKALFASYKQLADSGDAGNWRIEDFPEGKQALQAIAAAEQAQQAEPVALTNEQIEELWWGELDNRSLGCIRNIIAAAQPPAVAVPTIKLGIYGKAFDSPQTRRAYTYREQPNNIGAYKLGRAVLRAASGGDSIDYGLSLLKQLQAEGFGVFELGDQQEGGQQ